VTWGNIAVTILGSVLGLASGIAATCAVRRLTLVPRHTVLLHAALGLTLGALIGWRVAPAAYAAACLVFLAFALPLSAIDAATQQMPNRILLPAIPVCAAANALAAAAAHDYTPLWRCLMAGAVVFAAFTAFAMIFIRRLGFGDCKAAGLCALPLGYLSWGSVLLGVLLAYVLAAIYVVVVRATRSGKLGVLPFGPFLFAGCLAAVLVARY